MRRGREEGQMKGAADFRADLPLPAYPPSPQFGGAAVARPPCRRALQEASHVSQLPGSSQCQGNADLLPPNSFPPLGLLPQVHRADAVSGHPAWGPCWSQPSSLGTLPDSPGGGGHRGGPVRVQLSRVLAPGIVWETPVALYVSFQVRTQTVPRPGTQGRDPLTTPLGASHTWCISPG